VAAILGPVVKAMEPEALEPPPKQRRGNQNRQDSVPRLAGGELNPPSRLPASGASLLPPLLELFFELLHLGPELVYLVLQLLQPLLVVPI